MKRTGSIGSRVPPAVTSTWRPARSRRARAAASTRGDDVAGLGQAAGADVAAGQAALLGRDDVHAAAGAAAARLSCTAGCSHISVCIAGRDHDRRPGGEQGGGEQVVGDAGGVRRRGAGRWPGTTTTRSADWPSRVCGIGSASSNSDVRTGSEASAENVVAPTKRSAPSVRTGTTWAPASTRRRQTSIAL